MAEVDTGGGGGGRGKHKGGPRSKKKSTKIDMTAMVDVAFLLLTFFILTTTLATPQVMELNLPVKEEEDDPGPKVKGSKVLTLILGDEDKIYYYKGEMKATPEEMDIKTTAFGPPLREVINNHKQSVNDPILVIKPNETAKYVNVVDMLDEMTINKVSKYALAGISSQDSALLAVKGLK